MPRLARPFSRPPTAHEQTLWARYQADPSIDHRNALLVHYHYLADYWATRVATSLPKQVLHADLVSEGLFGLMHAIARFDPAQGVTFQTYSARRIRGAILDGLRGADHVPRSIRRRLGGDTPGVERLPVGLMAAACPPFSADAAFRDLLDRYGRYLTPRMRLILMLYYLADLSHTEIAQAMGFNPSRIGQLRNQALAILRHRIPNPFTSES